MAGNWWQAYAFTPRALDISEITTGGTAVVVLTGPCNGGYITNPPNAASQGIVTAESVYVDMVGVPGDADADGNGTTTILAPGQNFTIPSLAPGITVQVNAATTGHKLSGEIW